MKRQLGLPGKGVGKAGVFSLAEWYRMVDGITHLEPNLACDGAVLSANILNFCMTPGKL